MRRVLQEVQQKIKRKPVFVFEIKVVNPILIGWVRFYCNQWIDYADCIIVLSEADAVLHFGDDPDREQFILVSEPTVDEAHLMFEKRKLFTDYKLTDEDFKEYVPKLGTVPSAIDSILGDMMKLSTEVAHADSVDIMRANIKQRLNDVYWLSNVSLYWRHSKLTLKARIYFTLNQRSIKVSICPIANMWALL